MTQLRLDKSTFLLALVAVVVRAISGNNIVMIVYYALLFGLELYFLTNNRIEKIVEQIILAIPLMSITNFNGLPLGNIYISIFSIYLLFGYKRLGKSRNKLLLFSIIIFSDFFRYLMFSTIELSLVSIVSVPILYLCIFCGISVFEDAHTYDDIRRYMVSFIDGVILSVVYGFIVRFRIGGIRFALVNTDILTRNEGASGDPNYYGLYICIAVSFIVISMVMENQYKTAEFGKAFILLFMGMSSSSRMFFAMAAVAAIVLLLIMFRRLFTRNFFVIVGVLIVLGLSLSLYKYLWMDNINYVLSRLDTTDTYTLTNGRNYIISQYFDFMDSNPLRMLFGIGIAQYNVRSGLGAYAHNLYLEFYVTMGIIGILLFLLGIVIILITKKIRVCNLIVLFPVVIFLIGGVAINFLEVDSFYTLFGLIGAILCMESNKKGIIENYE